MYTHLLSPITINQTQIRNRVVYPALGLLYSYDGTLNDRYYAYFQEKAKGGTGIVTVGPVGIDELGSGPITMLLREDAAIPSFQNSPASSSKRRRCSGFSFFMPERTPLYDRSA